MGNACSSCASKRPRKSSTKDPETGDDDTRNLELEEEIPPTKSQSNDPIPVNDIQTPDETQIISENSPSNDSLPVNDITRSEGSQIVQLNSTFNDPIQLDENEIIPDKKVPLVNYKFLESNPKIDASSQTDFLNLGSTQNASSQTDIEIDNLPANQMNVIEINENDKNNNFISILDQQVLSTVDEQKDESRIDISENDESQQSIGQIKKNVDPNQDRLNEIVNQYDIDKDLSELGLDDSALDTSNIFEHFSLTSSDSHNSPACDSKLDVNKIADTKGGAENSPEPNESQNEDENYSKITNLNESTSTSMNININSAANEEAIKAEEKTREDNLPEIDEVVEFKRLDTFIKRKVSLTLDKNAQLDEDANTVDERVEEPIDNNLTVNKIVQAYNIYKRSFRKALEKQQSNESPEKKILKSDESIDQPDVATGVDEKTTFKRSDIKSSNFSFIKFNFYF